MVDANRRRIYDHHGSISEQIKDPFQEPNAKSIAKVVSLHIGIALAVVSPLFALLIATIGPGSDKSALGSCHPDGTFRHAHFYNHWARSGFFQINLGFGSMSFQNAKLLDVIWDVLVGRGGDLFLSLLPYTTQANSFRPRDSRLHCILGFDQVFDSYDGAETSFLRHLRGYYFS
jgi:hypothetical protein